MSGKSWLPPALRIKLLGWTCASAAVLAVLSTASSANAQTPPERSEAWSQATNILALSAGGLVLVMPRIFYSDPDVTVGWKARWHLSVLAPIMTIATVTLVNEHHLKETFKGFRPGCDESIQGSAGCTSYGMFSSPSFGAFAAVGHGVSVFLSDTMKWSDGRVNAGAFTGEVGVPLVLAIITAVGRTSGNWETGGQVWTSAGVGLGVGMGIGAIYALMQRPECGYSGNLLCW